MGGRLTIGSIAGIDIRIHTSWLIIALLIGWSFWSRFTILADRDEPVALVMAVVATVLFFASVLVHELAHSLEAQHRGSHVKGITLFIFGGATETSFDVDRPRDEFALTAIGPFSSFTLAAAFGLIASYSTGAGLEAVAEVAGLLGWLNLALGVFNLFPGAPLDGGRILRSAVWAITGDRGLGIRVASRGGQVLGSLIVALGVLAALFLPGGILSGIWFIVIGLFLAVAAKSEIVQHQMQERLQGLTVGELVSDEELPAVEADIDLATAAEQLRRQADDALRVTRRGATTGILLLDDVAGASEQERHRPVSELATPIDELPTVEADTELADAMGDLGGKQPIAVLRSDGGSGGGTGDPREIIGVLTPEHFQRVVQRTMQLGAPSSGGGPQRTANDASHLPESGHP